MMEDFDDGKHKGRNWFRMLEPLILEHIAECDNAFLEFIDDTAPCKVKAKRPGAVYFFSEDPGEQH